MTHRLFFALRPPRELRETLIDRMHGIANARWQDDNQLHLTLRYIGEVDRHEAECLAQRAGDIDFSPFSLQIAGVGTFETKQVPRSVWAGVKDSDDLSRLQTKLERLCATHQVGPPRRKFRPHVTLARLNLSAGPLADFLAENATLSLGPWHVDHYTLYESHLRAEGSIYEPIARYPARKC